MLNTKCLNEKRDFRVPLSIRSGSTTFGNPDKDKFNLKLYTKEI